MFLKIGFVSETARGRGEGWGEGYFSNIQVEVCCCYPVTHTRAKNEGRENNF